MVEEIIFNDISSKNDLFGIKAITKVSKDILSGTNDRTMDILGRDGVYDFGYDRQPIEISVKFFLRGKTTEEFKKYTRQIAKWLNVREAKQLILSDEPEVFYLARTTGSVDLDRLANTGEGEVTFFVPDPHAQSVADTIIGSSGSTWCYPENNGTTETDAIITVNIGSTADPVSYKQFELVDTGEVIKINTRFNPDDELVIDTAKRTVMKNGIDVREHLDIQSRYFKIPVGESSIRQTPFQLGASYTVEIRERWL